MDGRMDEWMDGRMDGWMDGWMDGKTQIGYGVPDRHIFITSQLLSHQLWNTI